MIDICQFHLKYKGGKTKRKDCPCSDFWAIKNLKTFELHPNKYHINITDIFVEGKYLLSKSTKELDNWLRFLGKHPSLEWYPSNDK